MKISVIAAQGDVHEHVQATRRALQKLKIPGDVVATLKNEDVNTSDAIIIPGGESTTISKRIHHLLLADDIKHAAHKNIPIMGTCAGSVLLASQGDESIHKTNTHLLGLMDVTIKRNAFGRQKHSFQTTLPLKHIGEVEAVFIRAPAITKAEPSVEVLATFNSYIVAARQKNIISFVFHPELTMDTRIHEYFIKMGAQTE
jgi:5'-phosphate synthase pdxT subunit